MQQIKIRKLKDTLTLEELSNGNIFSEIIETHNKFTYYYKDNGSIKEQSLNEYFMKALHNNFINPPILREKFQVILIDSDIKNLNIIINKLIIRTNEDIRLEVEKDTFLITSKNCSFETEFRDSLYFFAIF